MLTVFDYFMDLCAELYWPVAVLMFLVGVFGLSIYFFGKYYRKVTDYYVDKRWSKTDREEAIVATNVGIYLAPIALGAASLYGVPVYIVVGLGYLVTKPLRQRNAVRETLTKEYKR